LGSRRPASQGTDEELGKATSTTETPTRSFAPILTGPGLHYCLLDLPPFLSHFAGHCSSPRWLGQSSYSPTNMAAGTDGASSIQVTVRVRPFTIREAAQLARSDDGPLFLGDGSLAAAPAPHMKQKGIRPVLKVVDEKCL
jgi:hypothetical protein